MTNAIVGQAIVGQTVVGRVGGTFFTPPTIRRRMDTQDRLFSRMSLPVGITVLKSPLGSYTQLENPSPEQIDAAAVVYLGGYVYRVSDAEAASLTAAGYEVTTT